MQSAPLLPFAIGALATMVAATGCVTVPSRSADAAPAPAEPMAAPIIRRPALLEESELGDTPGFRTAPAAAAPSPSPVTTAGELAPAPDSTTLAALPPSPLAAPARPAEPESLLAKIGSEMPANTAAAMRLIEDGRQHLAEQRYDRALENFERAVTIDPSNAYGYYFLAQLHLVVKKYDQAIAFAGRAVALASRTDRVWQARAYGLQGAVFEQVGRYADARRAYQQAVAADPTNQAARSGMARVGGTQ